MGKLTTPDLFGPLKGLGIINLKDHIDNGALVYLVILTKDHPEGELRGQLMSNDNPYGTAAPVANPPEGMVQVGNTSEPIVQIANLPNMVQAAG
jgi:hypothetical protein